ncbi:MAG: secretin N-terminal domain-containing protein [Phycisphaerales bacterium JB054]
MMPLGGSLSLLLAAVLWAGVASPDAAAQPQGRVELSSVVELARLVDLAAERLGVNIEYDTKVSGSVTLRLNDEVSDTELWNLTNRLLAARGFTTVRMGDGDTLSVVPLSAAAGLARLESPAQQAAVPAGFRAVLVPVQARRPEDAVAALKPILSSSGTATAIAESRSVVIADLAARVEAALRAVETLEAGAAALAPVEIPLANLSAGRMVTLLSQIAAKRAAAGAAALRGEVLAGTDDRSLLVVAPADEIGRWQELVRQLDKREAVETVTYTPRAFSLKEVSASVERLVGGDERFRVVADELTGTLLVTASAAQQEKVRTLLDRLAEAPEAARRPTRSFKLKNRDAEEVLGVVQSLIASGALGLSQTPAAVAPSDERRGAIAVAAQESLQLTSDPATNSIIAIGEVQELQRLEQLLGDLDVRRPQVLLEVLIISLSESDALDLGVEIEAAINGPNDTVAKLASLFGLSSTGAGSAGIEGNRGAGFTGIVLNPGDFSVVLRALKNLNEGRSLSMPKVLVASNEQASINSVLEQPYTTLNASDTVATTSFGGSSNAGTEVSVTPQIAEGDHLRLEYQVSLSAFVGEAADPSVPPPRQQNSIDSVATIPDGYTIAVGGIELTTEGYSETGIPLLSDVPILGEAFKNRSKSSSRTRFYVFIRPTILRDRDFEDLKYLSDRDVADTGIDDGWPVPEPRLIR